MTEHTREWIEEIQEYAQKPGPIVLGRVLGISPAEAADKLIEHGMEEKFWRNGFTCLNTMAEVLDAEVSVTSLSISASKNKRVKFTDKYPTVHQWLSLNPDKIAILRIGHHLLYVAYGSIIEGAGFEPKHSRVTHSIVLGG